MESTGWAMDKMTDTDILLEAIRAMIANMWLGMPVIKARDYGEFYQWISNETSEMMEFRGVPEEQRNRFVALMGGEHNGHRENQE